MNKYILIMFLVVISSCSAQKNKTMKTFDIETFNKYKNHLNEYKFVKEDSIFIRQIEWQDNYEEISKSKNSFLENYKSFYKSGKIKMKVSRFPNKFLKGIMKEYDEQGTLVKETDYDAPYKFTWEDILKFIKKRKIDMDHEQFEITRGSNEKATSWTIVHDIKDVYKLHVINIDGITGEITREAELDYPSGGEYEDENDYPIEDE